MPTTWYADGELTGYDAATGTLLLGKVLLATDGSVDAEIVTRLQYPVTTFNPDTRSQMKAVAPIRVARSDYDAAVLLGGYVIGIMAVSPASAHTGVPSVASIISNARTTGLMFASLNVSPAPPPGGTIDVGFAIPGVDPRQLSPNTKYWAAVIPMIWVPGIPFTSCVLLPSAPPGRAVSFWSNRTPAAPVITSPSSGTVVASGGTIDLTITKNDPDSVFGGVYDHYTDCAGVHVQYAARPSADNPSPAWSDLWFTDHLGVAHNKGWWIEGSNSNILGEGSQILAQGPTVQVLCGSNGTPVWHGLLPSGSWQVRVRVFDFGHPYPSDTGPLGVNNFGGAYSPENYPASNTSPWSAPVIINVTAQVPSPVPIWPVDNIAVTEGGTVTLSWQYRNTAQPPFAQAKRTVRIRKVGDDDWFYLALDEVSSGTSIPVAGFDLVSGNLYEWQVAVEDTDGEDSTYSEVARFWMVPVAGSGGTRPVPSATIDGATLGCGNNRVFVYRRGGKERVAELTGLSSMEWNRVRDDISTAKVVISGWDVDCGNLLALLQPWAYELVIVRENGYSKDRVWEGPITLITYERESVTIQAKDVMGYAYRRIIKQKMTDTASGDTVTSRAARVLQNVFAPDDPNVLSYLTVMTRSDDAMQYRSTPAYSRTAFEEVDDMAANSGLDYTAVGRSILLWGTKHRIGTLPEFSDDDLGSTPIVSVYGMSMANVYSVSDGNGIHGEATRLDEFGNDEIYGLVEMLSSSWASDSAPESGTYTERGLQTVIESFKEFAERSIGDRYPPPVVVRVPDNTTVNPDASVSIQHLVPGVVIPLRSTGTLRTVVQSQKLDSVKVTQTEGVEKITLTMSPFSRDDTDTGEEGGE